MNSLQILFPNSLTEAISLLERYGEEAKVIAGGQSLVPMMNLGLFSPRYLVDLNRIPELREIRAEKHMLSIGALATHTAVAASQKAKEKSPVLVEVARQIGDVQVRSRGTIGGSISHADPTADYPAGVLAAAASMRVVGPNGERLIPAEKFFVDAFQTSMERNEVLTSVSVPESPPSSGAVYQRLFYVHGAFPVVGVAAVVTMRGKVVDRVGIGLTAVGPTALRPNKAENALLGKMPNADNLEKASILASEATNPTSDIHASAEYKKDMVRVFTRRALEVAVARASDGGKA